MSDEQDLDARLITAYIEKKYDLELGESGEE